jgi:hypothetical protein
VHAGVLLLRERRYHAGLFIIIVLQLSNSRHTSVRSTTGQIGVCAALLFVVQTALSQTGELHGQASGWAGADHSISTGAQAGLRYLPDLLLEKRLSDGVDAHMELSLNAFATARYREADPPSYDWEVRAYRGWIRLSTEKFEARIGLQKISFGSAMLFRPLMWFDRIDPRDPLQLTDGVYAVLARYYVQNNANFWLWGLYGNNDTKGWELAPTERKAPEYGGRAQSPLWSGEIGVTYHHRRADLNPLISNTTVTDGPAAPEDRLGLDGKWDIGIGVWFEAVLTHQVSDILLARYQRQWTAGADYTFPIGNGLYIATEYFRSERAREPFSSGEGAGFSALSLNYPVGTVDHVSALFYRDWTNHEWYRLLTWERTYDNWSFYLLGFWNPASFQIYHTQAGVNPFAGSGFQIMTVFNH